MARPSKNRKAAEIPPDGGGFSVIYARILNEDLAELRDRERETGATVAAQVRILIHEALRARRTFK